jgi:hypothetical protein
MSSTTEPCNRCGGPATGIDRYRKLAWCPACWERYQHSVELLIDRRPPAYKNKKLGSESKRAKP